MSCEQFISRPNTLLAPAELLAWLEALDELPVGIGMQAATTVTSDLVTLPVYRDPENVIADLRANGGDEGLLDRLVIGTADRAGVFASDASWRGLYGDGCQSGHGFVSWTPVAQPLPPAPWRPHPEVPGGRPVVALFDTAVQEHPWLATPEPEDRFWVSAVQFGWQTPTLWPPAMPNVYESHYGHGTFNAGVIRQHAPDAQVLSVQVMRDDGSVWPENTVAALEWLVQHARSRRVDVVCIPYGRERREGEGETMVSQAYRRALAELGRRSVQVVASVGNCGCDCLTYPAAYAPDRELPVISVGSGTPGEPDDFSNRGDWVEQWARGKKVVSAMPLVTEVPAIGEFEGVPDGYASWTGTSFAAAAYAGMLAQRKVSTAEAS